MIAVVIIEVLTIIAQPAYQDYQIIVHIAETILGIDNCKKLITEAADIGISHVG